MLPSELYMWTSCASCVRSGTFLGRLRVLTGGKSVDVATALLTAGLAKLHGSFRAAEQPGGPELEALEQKAKDARLKVLHLIHALLGICSHWGFLAITARPNSGERGGGGSPIIISRIGNITTCASIMPCGCLAKIDMHLHRLISKPWKGFGSGLGEV